VTFNTNDHPAQKYNIVEDLAEVPCVMLSLKFLKKCPIQRITLLSSINGAMDLEDSNLIMFNMGYFKERLSHHLAFQIQVLVGEKNIHHTSLDEGASTCVIYFPFF
jgi:hypothetical protein